MRIRKMSFVCIHKPWICLFVVYTVVYRMFSMCYWQMLSLLIDIKNFRYGFCWWWSYNCIVCNRISRNGFFQMNTCSYVHASVIWMCVHVNIRSDEKHMNNCSCIHPWLKLMLEHMNIWTLVHMWYMTLVVYNLIVRSCRIYHIENISQLTSYL